MKRVMIICAVLGTMCANAIDTATISRFQAKVNERQLIARETLVIGGVTNLVTTYRQSGVEWSVTNAVKNFTGVLAVKRYSRLRVYVACVRLGLWDKLESWLKTQTVDGVNAYTAFMLATELTADNELFIPMLNAAAAALGVDDATIQAVLSASEM